MADEYLGLGVAAHSYVDEGGFRRHGNQEEVERYIKTTEEGKRPLVFESALDDSDRRLEYIMLRLRLKSGISFADYQLRFYDDFKNTFKEAILRTEREGLIISDLNGIYPTQKGFDLQNMLIGEFIKKL